MNKQQSTRFKTGELTKESLKTILFDLDNAIHATDKTDKAYYYKLLKGNLKDIWGLHKKDDLVVTFRETQDVTKIEILTHYKKGTITKDVLKVKL